MYSLAICMSSLEKCLNNTGSPTWWSVMREVGWRERREVQEGGQLCIIMADLHCCMAETL